jgi:hypothetical protein
VSRLIIDAMTPEARAELAKLASWATSSAPNAT